MSRFEFLKTPIAGLKIARRKEMADDRGSFSRLFSDDEFAGLAVDKPIRQINRSVTLKKGTVRGMHFQLPPFAETKVVTCTRGEIFDVAIDLRRGSATFLKWYGATLSAANLQAMFIPEGFAHGFQTLQNDCELIYLHTAPYDPASERALNPLDSRLDISWPLSIDHMSDKDRAHAFLSDDFGGIEI